MNSLSKKIQKLFVYAFSGISIILVVVGVSRVKKTEPIAKAPSPSQANTSKTALLGSSIVSNFTGKIYQTPWGDVATKIQVKDGKIVAVTIPTLPDSPPSTQAEPYLIAQAIKAGGSNIQGVSGATITSRAFQASLESALAQAANANTGVSVATTNTNAATTSITPKVTTAATPTKTTATKTTIGVSGTFSGKAYQTPWGNAVASITVSNGKITGVTMPQVPPSPPSQYAEQYLVAQALAAGSANIQGVSGATYTSLAFKSSLESAISLANTTASAKGQTTVAPSTTTTSSNAPTKASVPQRYREDDEWDD